MSEIDGTPTVTDGDTEAPTPSAEQGDSGPESMAEYVQQEFNRQFRPETDTADPEPEPAQADPEPAPVQDELASDLDAEHPDAPALPDLEAKAQASPEPDQPTEPEPDEEIPDEELEFPDHVTEDELQQQYHSNKGRKRVKRLLQQRYELRQQLAATEPVMKTIRDNRLSNDDVQMALGLTASLARGDFKAFREGVAPLLQVADQYLGNQLSPELQQQVDQGYIAPELAAQYQAQQTQNLWHQEQLRKQQEESQRQAQQQEAARVQAVLRRSVNDWEAQTRAQDPDYARKEPTIRRMAQALLGERGAPRTPEEAIALAKDAYDEATRQLSGYAPPPPPRPTRPAPTAAMTPRAGEAEPTSMLDAVKQGLRKAHSA